MWTKNKPKETMKNNSYKVLAIFFLKDKAKPTKNKHQIDVKNHGSNMLNLTKSILAVKSLVHISKLIKGTIDNKTKYTFLFFINFKKSSQNFVKNFFNFIKSPHKIIA